MSECVRIYENMCAYVRGYMNMCAYVSVDIDV